MARGTVEAPRVGNQGGKSNKPVKMPVFYAFLVVAILVIIIELVWFPNLTSNFLYLALVVFTTLLAFGSIGATVSGLRPTLPRWARLSLTTGLWGFVVLDFIFLVLPNFISGPPASDESVAFVGSAATVNPGTTSGPGSVNWPNPTSSIAPPATLTVKPVDTPFPTAKPVDATAKAPVVSQPTPAAQTTVAVPPTPVPQPTPQPTPPPVSTTKAAEAPAPPKAAGPLAGNFNNQGAEPVSGKAQLGVTADGKLVLRFDNFSSAPGPDLVVYLSKNATPTNDGQVKNGFEVGKLKATKGNQNYELPSSLDFSQIKSVVVYCKSFSIIFGFANLA